MKKAILNLGLIAGIAFSTITTTCPPSHALNLSRYLEDTYPDNRKTISMDLQGARLNDVLKIFSQQSGLNFIAASDVANDTVTLYLDKVPVEMALERILSSRNLTYEIDPESNIFLVKRLVRVDDQAITRVYQLKHATVPSSKLVATIADFEEAGSTIRNDSKDFGIIAVIESLLSDEGSVQEDPRTNSIIVTDIPSRFPKIEQAIARLDVRVPQILIEVEMLDVTATVAEKIGAKWGDAGVFNPIKIFGAKRETLFPFDGLDSLGAEDFTPATSTPALTLGEVDYSGLLLTIELLRSDTETKNLARPKILTLNNETAEIRISTDEVVGVDFEVGADGGSTETTAERAQTGVFLLVTPQADVETGEITMALQPKVIQSVESSGVASAANFKDLEERGTKSIVRVFDGDTIILGGLLRNDKTKASSKVPFFGDMPIFGAAFRNKSNENTERELIVFITPHIVQEDFSKRITSKKKGPLVREQSVPTKRLQAINKELTIHEKKRF